MLRRAFRPEGVSSNSGLSAYGALHTIPSYTEARLRIL